MAGTITGETKRLGQRKVKRHNQLAGTKRKKGERASPSRGMKLSHPQPL